MVMAWDEAKRKLSIGLEIECVLPDAASVVAEAETKWSSLASVELPAETKEEMIAQAAAAVTAYVKPPRIFVKPPGDFV